MFTAFRYQTGGCDMSKSQRSVVIRDTMQHSAGLSGESDIDSEDATILKERLHAYRLALGFSSSKFFGSVPVNTCGLVMCFCAMRYCCFPDSKLLHLLGKIAPGACVHYVEIICLGE